MNIQIETKKTDGAERLLEVSVAADEVRAATERTARRYATKVRLPGFRAGKAPAHMVLKKFADAIRQNNRVDRSRSVQTVLEREQLKVAAQPHIHDLKFTEGEPLTFNLHVELRLRSAWRGWQGFASPATSARLPKRTSASRSIRSGEQRANWSPVSERPREGDLVTVQLSTTTRAARCRRRRNTR